MDNSKIVGGSSANYRQLSSESPHRLNTYPISIEYYREHVDIAGALVCLRTNFSAKFLPGILDRSTLGAWSSTRYVLSLSIKEPI